MASHAYSKGTLLWVDDNFQVEAFRKDQPDVDRWNMVFSGIENRVYRLLGLRLTIATTLEQALKVLGQHDASKDNDKYLVAVVDLNIPKSELDDEPLLKHGIRLARKLKEMQIPFYFLSSMSSAIRDLKAHRLETIPYHTKSMDDAGMMPETLARLLLNDFRNRISWIDLAPLHNALDKSSLTKLSQTRQSHTYFPFFGGFRDFVERWEYRPMLERNATLILRSPRAHSDQFVMQCMLFVLAQRISKQQKSAPLRIEFDNCEDEFKIKALKDKLMMHGQKGNVYRHTAFIIRVNERSPVTASEFTELIKLSKHVLVIFVLPADQAAEKYLNELPNSSKNIYDSLPFTYWSDKSARADLIEKSCQFVFQNIELDVGAQKKVRLGEAYLKYPEMLIHPTNWNFLRDSDDVLEDISDPVEILEEFGEAAKRINALSAKEKFNLKEGRPISPEKLLKVGEVVEQKAPEENRMRWKREALAGWLNSSWQFPYGYNVCEHQQDDEQLRREWEEHTVQVLAMLSAVLDKKQLRQDDEIDSHILAAKIFLEHKAIQGLITSKREALDWGGLESIRWPHLIFPLPAALNRLLKEEGRYLWVQSDFLDNATVLPSGRKAHRTLESLAVQAHAKIAWLDEVIPTLPQSWQGAVSHIRELLDGQIASFEHRDQTEKNELWYQLRALLRNCTPISLLFHYLVRGKAIAGNQNSAQYKLANINGYGELLGGIRGGRAQVCGDILKTKNTLDPFINDRSGELHEYATVASELLQNVKGTQVAAFFNALMAEIVEGFAKKDNNDSASELTAILARTKLPIHKNDWFNSGKKEVTEAKQGKRPQANGEPEDNTVWSCNSISGFPSLFGTRLDHVWQLLDALQLLRNHSFSQRYFDGYHFLAVLDDLRVRYKDNTPKYSYDDVVELFVWGFEGLVAQLKFCLQCAGHNTIADAIPLHSIEVNPKDVAAANLAGLDKCLKVEGQSVDNYEVYSLGIIGSGTVKRFSTDDGSGNTLHPKLEKEA